MAALARGNIAGVAKLAFITFNRPEARNAMTWAMYDALLEACETVDANPDIRVFILRGAGGKSFVSGTDISQFQTFREPSDAINYERRVSSVLARLARELLVVAVTHDLNLALRYAHHVLVLEQGRLAAAGSAHEVLTSSLIERVFQVRASVERGAVRIEYDA